MLNQSPVPTILTPTPPSSFSLKYINHSKITKTTMIPPPPPVAVINKIKSVIEATPSLDTPFYALHIPTLRQLVHQWDRHFHPITPFYAVKCNPDPALLRSLSDLNLGFDCASMAEIVSVLDVTANSPDRIVYANPCKHPSHLAFAAGAHVDLTTFDNLDELRKINLHHPTSSLLLRIKPQNSVGVLNSFGSKYGALFSEVTPLLHAAMAMNLEVVGVCFHIGTGATVYETYDSAIELSRRVFDLAYDITNVRMNVLDIGGGFIAADDESQLEDGGNVIRASLTRHFGDWPTELRLMAEPGRYFAQKAFTLTTRVLGKRVRGEKREYWINDGVYGSMLCNLLEGAVVTLLPLREVTATEKLYRSTVFGPTLDSVDVVKEEVMLPEMEVGDWFVSPDMGAYTKTLGSEFNGFSTSEMPVYVVGSLDD